MKHAPVALIILDGWGLREESRGNAVRLARKPNFDRLFETFPTTKISASALDVGLPRGQMGNSEVGHMNLGAGRVVMQDLTRISLALESGEFARNACLRREFEKVARGPTSTLHLLGLVSDGGIHSHIDHLLASLDLAQQCGIQKAFVHCFTDGRDTAPKIADRFIAQVEAHLQKIQYGRIATVCGRFYAMDRDKRWERVEKAWRAVCLGEGLPFASALAAVHAAQERGETDEFITPSVMLESQKPLGTMHDGDGIFFFNFRPDRCRELISALHDTNWPHFPRPRAPKFSTIVSMTRYHEDYPFPVAFEPMDLSWTLGEIVSAEGLAQLRIAETEKFPHVTFFFSGGRDERFAGEERILIPSPRDVKTYDQKPQMSAFEVTDALVGALQKTPFPFIMLNFANPDMVGHTGVLEAGIKAVETIDTSLGRVVAALETLGGKAIITADHGNCEQMIADDGTPHTSHTTNLVPLILYDPARRNAKLRPQGILADVAPTLVELLDLKSSASFEKARALMNGRTLLA